MSFMTQLEKLPTAVGLTGTPAVGSLVVPKELLKRGFWSLFASPS